MSLPETVIDGAHHSLYVRGCEVSSPRHNERCHAAAGAHGLALEPDCALVVAAAAVATEE